MRKPTHPLPDSGTADDIEALFYEALQTADIEKLLSCWADEDDIVCVHPGGSRLLGAGAIRSSFEAMFAVGSLRVTADKVRRVDSLGSSVHSVLERVEVMTEQGPRHAWVIATNVYLKTPLGWRMVAHHASPGTPQELADVAETPAFLH